MTSKDKLIQMINNLNDDGINAILFLIEDFDKLERYNINTTPERLEDLQQIREQRDAEIKAEREKASFERAVAKYDRQKAFKASLTGKEKKFFEVVERVNPGTRYCMDYWELILLGKTYNNSLLDGCYDIFRYGFLKGQRAEKARQKRLREKARAC